MTNFFIKYKNYIYTLWLTNLDLRFRIKNEILR